VFFLWLYVSLLRTNFMGGLYLMRSTSKENARGERLWEAGGHQCTQVLLIVAHLKAAREWAASTGSVGRGSARDYYVGPNCTRVQKISVAFGCKYTRLVCAYLSRVKIVVTCPAVARDK
jgi:hypothetical protein